MNVKNKVNSSFSIDFDLHLLAQTNEEEISRLLMLGNTDRVLIVYLAREIVKLRQKVGKK